MEKAIPVRRKPFLKRFFLFLTALLFLQSQDLGSSTTSPERPARRPFSRAM